MRLTRQKSVLAVPQLNMASMVDVVFLLLIFFMCTSSLNQPENDISSQLSGRGQRAVPERLVRIRLLNVATGVLITCDERSIPDFLSLETELQRRASLEDRPVVIEGQAGVPFRFMVAALDACHRAGVRRVAFSPREVKP